MSKTKVIIDNIDFPRALAQVMVSAQVRIARAGWNGSNQYVRLIKTHAPHPDDVEEPRVAEINPYFRMADNNAFADGTFVSFLVIKNAQNQVVPWLPSMGDLLATDWQILK